jgi:hypothetical protein
VRFEMFVGSVRQLPARRHDLAIVGQAVDERGQEAVNVAQACSKRVAVLQYDPDALECRWDGQPLQTSELESKIGPNDKSILLESTTLGFVEVFLAMRAVQDGLRPSVSVLYAEPEFYRRPIKGEVLRRRDFELTDEVEMFTAIPGAAVMLSERRKQRVIFALGYEGQRLEQAFEQTELRGSQAGVVFGVPGFRPGWEMDSFANNVRVLEDRQVRDVRFAAAENPRAVFGIVEGIHRGCRDETLVLAPIGTKPHGIGMAAYACVNRGVGLIYDHPQRSVGRSTRIGRWHYFNLKFPRRV